jgi:hypothetical protein
MFSANRRTLLRVAGLAALAGTLSTFPSTADAQEKIRIGYAISKTGPYAGGAGITTLPNYELWVKDVNAAGGIKLGDKKLPKPPGWMSDKWRGDSMPKSEMSAWCTHSRKKCGEAGFEIEDQKADGPKLIGLIEGFLAGLGFDPGGAPKQ